MNEHKYRGYLYNLREPRYPVSVPQSFTEQKKNFKIKSSLVKGKPVLPPTPAQGFLHGTEAVGELSENERRKNKVNLKMLEKTSAEIRKQQRQQHDRLEFMASHKKFRDEETKQKRLEQEEDLRQLKSYNPFGKPGFGAPRGPAKKDLIMNKTMNVEKDGVGRAYSPTPAHESPRQVYELPPGPHVQRYEDDRMRRYKVSPETAQRYKKDLDGLIDIKRHNEELRKSIEREREKVEYDPFGRPGAGAPNRDEKGDIMARKLSEVPLESTRDTPYLVPCSTVGRKIIPPKSHSKFAEFNTVDEFMRGSSGSAEKIYLEEKHCGSKHRLVSNSLKYETKSVSEAMSPTESSKSLSKASGEIEKRIQSSRRTSQVSCGFNNTRSVAEIMRQSENIMRVATPDDVRKSGRGESPWGRAGGGAPIIDSQGEIMKTTKGRIKHEAMGYTEQEEATIERAKKIYRDDLKQGIVAQQQLREEENKYLRLPPGDVPSWFSKGKVGRPQRDPTTGVIVPHPRTMSDITAQKFNSDRPRDREKYYEDLRKMAEDRYLKRAAERERILKQEIKHAEKFNTYFENGLQSRRYGKSNRRHKLTALDVSVSPAAPRYQRRALYMAQQPSYHDITAPPNSPLKSPARITQDNSINRKMDAPKCAMIPLTSNEQSCSEVSHNAKRGVENIISEKETLNPQSTTSTIKQFFSRRFGSWLRDKRRAA